MDEATRVDLEGWSPQASVSVLLEGSERPWEGKHFAAVRHVSHLTLSALPDGTVGGNPTVALCIDLGDVLVVGEVTLAALLTALDTVVAAYGDPREGGPPWVAGRSG